MALSNTFEGGSDGTTITTGNSGGVSGNAFDNITIGTSAACTFSRTRAVHGALSMSVSTAGTAAQTYAQWSTALGSQIALWGRAYLYLTGAPASNEVIVQFLNTATVLSNMRLLTTRALQIGDSAGNTVFTLSTLIPLNQWVRIEWAYTFPGSATGQVTLKLFLGPDTFSADESQTSTATQNFASLACNTVRYGWLQAVANSPQAFFDDINANSNGFPGPSAEFARPDMLFLPSTDPVGLPAWGGAPDSDHSVIAYAHEAAGISFRNPSPRLFSLLALTGETGQSATVQTFNDSAPLGPLFTPDDVTGGIAPWRGADATVAPDVTATAGVAAFTLTAQQPVTDLGALPGTAALALTTQTPTASLAALPDAAPVTFAGQQASEVPVDSPFASAPPLLTPDNITGGIAPWDGAAAAPVSVDATATAGVASVSFTGQQAVTDLGALPGAAPASFIGLLAVTSLGVLPGAAPVSFTGQQPVTSLGALPGAAPVTTSALSDTAGLTALSSAAPVAFVGQSATTFATEDPQSCPLALLTPDDLTGGMAPWAGAPQGLVTGDAVVNAGVATVSLTALNVSSAVAVQGTGTAAVSLTAQNPSAAFSGTATAGRATVTVTALGASTGLGSVPGTATVGLSARQPVAGTGVLPGVGTIGLTAYDPTVIVPQSASGRTISGREGVSTVSGKEGIGLATGREGIAQVSGREPVSSRSGEEPEADIKGRET